MTQSISDRSLCARREEALPRNLPPILPNPNAYEISHSRPQIRDFSIRKAGHAMLTGYHQEARLGFRRRKASVGRLRPLDHKVAAPDSTFLSLPTPTRARTNHQQAKVEAAPSAISTVATLSEAIIAATSEAGDNDHLEGPTSNVESPDPRTVGGWSSMCFQESFLKSFELEVESVNRPIEDEEKRSWSEKVQERAHPIKVTESVDETITPQACDMPELEVDTLEEMANAYVVSLSVDAFEEIENAHAGDQESLLRSQAEDLHAEFSTLPELPSTTSVQPADLIESTTSLQPADLIESIRQRAAMGMYKCACEGQLGAVLKAGTTSLQPADVVESIRKRAAKGMCKSACEGQLGAVLKAATSPDVIHEADEVMPQNALGNDEDAGMATRQHGLESACVVKDAPAVDSLFLAKLRKQAAVQFVAAAQSEELRSALQIATNPEGNQPILNQGTQEVAITPIHADGGVPELVEIVTCEQENTASEDPTGSRVDLVECSLLQKLRHRALLGISAAARAGNLGSILQSASDHPAPQSNPDGNFTMPPRAQTTPLILKTPSSTSLSQGGCSTMRRQIVPAPTGLPTPSGDCPMAKSAVGRPGSFRRRHSRTSSKILS